MSQNRFSCLLYLSLFFSSCAHAESFLMPQAESRRTTVSQVKQKIAEQLANILRESNKNVQLRSQLQIKLVSLPTLEAAQKEMLKQLAISIDLQVQFHTHIFNRLQDLFDNNKNAFLNKAYKPELLACLQELEQIYKQVTEQQARMQQELTTVKLDQLKTKQELDQQQITKALAFIKDGCAVSIKK